MRRFNQPCDLCGEKVEVEIDVYSSGYHKFTCPEGHENEFIITLQQFDLLFNMGAYALNEKYYLEAVILFATALERFYETFIKVYCYELKINVNEIDELFKRVTFSPQEYGAFTSIYLIWAKELPNKLSRGNVELRNRVAHRGNIPSKEESYKYGQAVLDIISPIINKMCFGLKVGMKKLRDAHSEQAYMMAGKRTIPHMTVHSMLQFSEGSTLNNMNLKELIEHFKNNEWA